MDTDTLWKIARAAKRYISLDGRENDVGWGLNTLTDVEIDELRNAAANAYMTLADLVEAVPDEVVDAK